MPYKRKYKKSTRKRSTKSKKVKSRTPKVDRVFTKVFKYVATTPATSAQAQGCLLGNANGISTSDNIGWRLSNIPGVTDYRPLYTHYRFDRLTVKFVPMTVDMLVDDQDEGTSASNISKAVPRFYLSRLWGNEVNSEMVWQNEDSAILTARKHTRMTKPLSFSWVPNTLIPTQTVRASANSSTLTPSNVGWMPVRKRWHSLQDTANIWYGLKYFISSTFQDNNEFMYKCLVYAKISFKGQNDANYGVQSPGGSVLIPFTALTSMPG